MTGNTEKYSENKMDDKVDAGLKRPGKDQGKKSHEGTWKADQIYS